MRNDDLIHVTVVGRDDDPRSAREHPDGVVMHHSPGMHPDDVVTMPDGLRLTSVSRTLVDLADELSHDELRAAFRQARELGTLDIDAVAASAARVEWRPSLEILYGVMAEFGG